MTATLEKTLNRYLRLDPHTMERMADLSGKVVLIELPDWKLKFYLMPTESGVRLLNHYEGTVDTIIRGTPIALFRLSKTSGTDSKLFSEISITGDVELGQQFRELLHNIDIDWEEQISKFTGDVIGHQIGNMARRFKQWGKETRSSLQQNLTEYLQEEVQLLPPRQEVEDFFSDVKALQHDLARLEATLQHINIDE